MVLRILLLMQTLDWKKSDHGDNVVLHGRHDEGLLCSRTFRPQWTNVFRLKLNDVVHALKALFLSRPALQNIFDALKNRISTTTLLRLLL